MHQEPLWYLVACGFGGAGVAGLGALIWWLVGAPMGLWAAAGGLVTLAGSVVAWRVLQGDPRGCRRRRDL